VIDYQPLYQALRSAKADAWAESLPQQLNEAFDHTRHGHLATWQKLIDSIPDFSTKQRILDADIVQIGSAIDLTELAKTTLEAQLKSLHPWRKGPYDLFGININAEWRSDWKWRRVEQHTGWCWM
jgi:tRNA (mo5U34)-methyltransferase